MQFFVGAFHGYAHSWQCQLCFHPWVVTVAGLEDFETCEWVFRQQNQTAPLFWHSSSYHCHMTMDWFYCQWNSDWTLVLGAYFLAQNYKQALKIINQTGVAVDSLMANLECSPDNLQMCLQQEKEYFRDLIQEPEEEQMAFWYLEMLQELELEWYMSTSPRLSFN
ncbi:hypothetical protein DACRYDRAFT_57133 [Dacryopinax primogenitus]|uniref:Uncharacterized protein n=1 Tax=Dacryopinax primogenitus (strain DJM 731) TaxID=1858805 RepID=M5G4B5_DACPD|nr:uncharacterized protein DACRYDRAFT_57133 [Dacryopinax primogenitus]EJT98587.1 hypothetical protein DACRYDRAFT_57133 [Dacryopinax primogenitus]